MPHFRLTFEICDQEGSSLFAAPTAIKGENRPSSQDPLLSFLIVRKKGTSKLSPRGRPQFVFESATKRIPCKQVVVAAPNPLLQPRKK